MEMRTSKPAKDNKFYVTIAKGGYSKCIKGSPTDECDVLANCVGYACGRFNEIIGEMKYPTLYCNAENFIERAKSLGLQVVDYPTLGGILVWQKGSTLNSKDGAGHVAIVENIIDKNTIYTSESGYGTKAFWNARRSNKNGRWSAGTGYTFRGCIVNPSIGDVHYEEHTETIEQLARDVIAGKYGNGETRKQALGSKYNEVQAKVNEILYRVKQPNNDDITYIVKKGDTLSSIAKKYNITWQELYNKNKEIIGSNPNLIKVGQKLKIRG